MSESLKSRTTLDALDMAESLFSTLKKELIYRKKFAARQEARREIFDFIEIFYNKQRIYSYLGDMSPAEFETAAA